MSVPSLQVAAPEPSRESGPATTSQPPEGAASAEFLRFFGDDDPANPAHTELVAIARRLAPRTGTTQNAPVPARTGKSLPLRNPLGPPMSPETIVARVGSGADSATSMAWSMSVLARRGPAVP